MGEIPNYRLDGRNPENYLDPTRVNHHPTRVSHHPTRVVGLAIPVEKLSGRNPSKTTEGEAHHPTRVVGERFPLKTGWWDEFSVEAAACRRLVGELRIVLKNC